MRSRIGYLVTIAIIIVICIVPPQATAGSVSSHVQQAETVTFWWNLAQVWWTKVQQLLNSVWNWFVSLMHGLGL